MRKSHERSAVSPLGVLSKRERAAVAGGFIRERHANELRCDQSAAERERGGLLKDL